MIIHRYQNRFRVGLLLGFVLLLLWAMIAYWRWELDHMKPPARAVLVRQLEGRSGRPAA